MPSESPTLETERLRLEPLRVLHAPALLAYQQRNRAHFERWEPVRDTEYYAVAHHQGDIERCIADPACARFVAFDASGGDIVASFNLWNMRRGVVQAAILGYSVDAGCEGRGYATEGAAALVRFAFGALNLHRLETSYQPENARSGRVLEKLGFVVEGHAREYLFLNGAWRDGVLVSLINSEWQLVL